MRTMTAPQIALMQNRAGKLSVTFALAYKTAGWNATGNLTLEDVFEYWFDKEKMEIEIKDTADLGVLLSYYNVQLARIIITETLPDGVTTVSEPSPPYFVYSYSYLPKGRMRLMCTSL